MRGNKYRRVNLTMPHDLHDRWEKVANKMGTTKSAMLRDMLEQILPTLEYNDVNSMFKSMLALNGDVLKQLSEAIELKK